MDVARPAQPGDPRPGGRAAVGARGPPSRTVRRAGRGDRRATCTTPARRTRSGRTRCASWRRRSGRTRSTPAGPGPSPAARAGSSSTAASAFRHELASLLLLDGPLRDLLADAPDPDLARYLVLAHHGKLRVQVRDPGDLAVLAPGEASEHKLLGLDEGSVVRHPAAARPARCRADRGPGPVRARRRAFLDPHRARAARPVRAVRPGLPGDARAGRGLARQRRRGA